jgi:hypothetical protein
MAQRGRPTSVTSMLERLGAAPVAKERMVVMLANLSGTVPVAEACRRLGLGRTQFWSLRTALLGAALRAVEPRRRGRPAREHPLYQKRALELEAEIARLKEALDLARVREEIALLLPWTGRGQQKRARRTRRPKPAAKPPGSLVS